MHASSDSRYVCDIFFRVHSRKTQRRAHIVESYNPFSIAQVVFDREATCSPFPDKVISVAASQRMLHSSNSRVHFPALSSGFVRQNARSGRLHITAAIKKGKEKNVVCAKTIVAKQDTVSSHAQE